MRTVILASLRSHTRRYVSAALAVVIAVGFVVATAGISAAAREGLTQGVGIPYEGADVVVSNLEGATADRLVSRAADHDASATVLGWTIEPVSVDGNRLDDAADVAEIATDPALRWQTLVDGRFPSGPGEAAVDADAAVGHDIRLGQTIRVGSGATTTTAEVVAFVDSPSVLLSGGVYLTWPDLRSFADRIYVDGVAWRGPTAAIDTLAPGATVQDRDDAVAERRTEVNNGVDVIAIVLLLFAAVALFVGVLVIANTFSILFAQRRHDLALLRCVGATRKQVERSIRVEALTLGLVASLLGLGLGTLGAFGIVGLVGSRWPQANLGQVSIAWQWFAGALALGVVATLVASVVPTRTAVRTPPLAALRPEAGIGMRSAAGRFRLAAGALGVAGGAALLALSVAVTSPLVMVVGGGTTFTGVLLLGPVLVPALVRLVGGAVGRIGGPAVRLATGNAVRNPRRTAATASSLLVGVTLTTAVLTGMASARDAVDGEMDGDHPLDAALLADRALPADLLASVRDTPDVTDAIAVPGVTGRVAGVGRLTLLGVTDTSTARAPGRVTPRGDELIVPVDTWSGTVPRRVAVSVGEHTVRLRVRAGDGFGQAALVSAGTLARLGGEPATRAIWVRADDGVDADRLGGALEALGTPLGADLESGVAARADVDLQLDVVTGAVVGLLGIAVVIALIGIANTLGLSVLERAREHALLRALGLTRRQLRGTLAMESVLLSVVATLVGTTLGVTFAWVGVQALIHAVVADAPVVLPWGQLALVVLVSAVAGLLACVLPARRATRTPPAAGLTAL